jgi:hypothetical protein
MTYHRYPVAEPILDAIPETETGQVLGSIFQVLCRILQQTEIGAMASFFQMPVK